MVGKAQQKELEAVGHTAFRVRKQGDRNAGAQLTFSSIQPRTPTHGMVSQQH